MIPTHEVNGTPAVWAAHCPSVLSLLFSNSPEASAYVASAHRCNRTPSTGSHLYSEEQIKRVGFSFKASIVHHRSIMRSDFHFRNSPLQSWHHLYHSLGSFSRASQSSCWFCLAVAFQLQVNSKKEIRGKI